MPSHLDAGLSSGEVESLLELLQSGADPKQCLDAIRNMFAQQETADALLNGACDHPEGFCSIPLGKLGQQAIVRLHLWTTRLKKVVEWRAHTHSWDVHSMILHGAVTNHTFKVSQIECGPERLYKAPHVAGLHLLEETAASVVAQELGARTYTAGQSYNVLHGTFHSTHMHSEPLAVTLVSFTNPQEIIPLVVGPPNLGVQSTPHAACDRAWVYRTLSALTGSPLLDTIV
jgi:hypothetical protein